jgi:hypothetical protein
MKSQKEMRKYEEYKMCVQPNISHYWYDLLGGEETKQRQRKINLTFFKIYSFKWSSLSASKRTDLGRGEGGLISFLAGSVGTIISLCWKPWLNPILAHVRRKCLLWHFSLLFNCVFWIGSRARSWITLEFVLFIRYIIQSYINEFCINEFCCSLKFICKP